MFPDQLPLPFFAAKIARTTLLCASRFSAVTACV